MNCSWSELTGESVMARLSDDQGRKWTFPARDVNSGTLRFRHTASPALQPGSFAPALSLCSLNAKIVRAATVKPTCEASRRALITFS
jgi:hypothetical protein